MMWLQRKIVSPITCAIFSALLATAAGAGPIRGDQAFEIAANTAIDRITQADGFSGAILVARGREVLVRRASGFADRERKNPNATDTKFPLESITKQFTATAILSLAEQGKLS